jgi:peptide/nickel transport system substrate-binding protein
VAKSHKSKIKTDNLVAKVGDRAVDLQASSSGHVKKHFFGRLKNVQSVRRFIIGWLALASIMVILTTVSVIQIYRASHTTASAPGGTYIEGMVGEINNLNPIFSQGVLDSSTSKLLFNGLLRYDTEGKLVPDLAESYSVADDSKTYSFKLKEDVKWHDGQPFTADDVVYTIKTIQNPSTRSTQFSGWEGITVTSPNKFQVDMVLPAPLAPFAGSLTMPIIPEHLFTNIKPDKLRSANFNTEPVGTGPFVMQVLRTSGGQQQLELKRNDDYFRGAPQLDRFILRTFSEDQDMNDALRDREITAAVGLETSSLKEIEKDSSIRVQNIPLYSGVYGFFNNTNSILSDVKVRSALVKSTNRKSILTIFDTRYPPLKTPLLPTQLGFNSAYSQTTNYVEADRLLTEAGWVKQKDGPRLKDGAPLELNVTTVDSSDQVKVVAELQRQWAKMGVTIKTQVLTADQLSQNALATHDYDILLYGISIDHDPDVFAYWHSSQARPGANNFSEWKSTRADTNLGVARSRLDPVLRAARYQTFQDEWLKGAPAVALYQLQTTYSVHQNASGFISVASTNAADRLTNVEDWTVNTRSVLKSP